MSPEHPAPQSQAQAQTRAQAADHPTSVLLVALAWLVVVVPLAYGLWQTLVKAAQLLGG